MKIYLSAAWHRREEMQKLRDELIADGFWVRSRWLDPGAKSLSNDVAADIDLDDISDCDVFVTFGQYPGSYYTGGRHVELGFALGLGLTCLLVGPPENVFHHYSGVKRVVSVVDLKKALKDGEFQDPDVLDTLKFIKEHPHAVR